jgi:hypothetical protein
MMKREELEIQRHNVTVSQFLAYVRAQIKKHGLEAVDPADIDLDYFKAGNDLNFDYHDIPGKPCKAEKSVSKPYEMQTYIMNWDGTAYNFIMEFDFWDEKTGSGYFYFLNTWKEETEKETETREEENQEETENNDFALDYIYNGLKSGKVYGHYMENVRFPSFYWNLCYDRIRNYFFWSNAGSSANKATKENLRWIIEGIFKTSPLAFLGKYMEKSRARRN